MIAMREREKSFIFDFKGQDIWLGFVDGGLSDV